MAWPIEVEGHLSSQGVEHMNRILFDEAPWNDGAPFPDGPARWP